MSRNVLIVDDDEDLCRLLHDSMEGDGLDVSWCTDPQQALDRVLSGSCDVVLTDVRMGEVSGLDLCERLVVSQPDVPVIVMTAFGSMEVAVAALRVGAHDFITKPIELPQLRHTVLRALEHRELHAEVRRLRERVGVGGQMHEMVGDSPAMEQVYSTLAHVAETDATVLITGESGTGKELAARALHERSPRAKGPFVAINCAAMPLSLLESELFGHLRGAFTGASGNRTGLFVRANGGTIFLDEIGEMPQEMQPKLLRALQEGCVRPVGGDTEVPFDARIVAATNCDLEEMVERGAFRRDLFYRINVVPINMPRLQDRGNDVLMLAQHFLEQLRERTGRQVRGFSAAAARRLLEYDWPGNVRELKNCIERAVALARLEEITVEEFPARIRNFTSTTLVGLRATEPEQLPTLEAVERSHISRVLHAVGGNKAQAAVVLGLHRRTLYRKLKRFELASV